MRKLLLLLLALTFGLGLKAQCPLQTAVDFMATDCHGNKVHLFDILDDGQYVLIDFFYYNCAPCITTAPMLAQSYQAFGCNLHDVFYMEISYKDSDATCQNWIADHGIEYPTIGNAGGGGDITNQYGISSWPTVILIAPDRSIVIHDLYPIPNTQTIITALEAQGIQQHICNYTIEETTTNLALSPNPANDFVTLKGENLGMISIYNTLGQKLNEFFTEGDELNINTTNYENGIYFIKSGEQVFRFVITH